jgi:predicted DNA-binding WGR domain protein
MSAVTLYRVDPARNMRRFYRLDLQPDLFGAWCVVREWGRIGRPGQTRVVSYHSIQAARLPETRGDRAPRTWRGKRART